MNSSSQGMLEMVPNSEDLSGVKSIRAFLKEKHPDSSSDLGIKPEVLDTYVKSCAGYAVITYLLGIGDRHLNNIMLDVFIRIEIKFRIMVICSILTLDTYLDRIPR